MSELIHPADWRGHDAFTPQGTAFNRSAYELYRETIEECWPIEYDEAIWCGRSSGMTFTSGCGHSGIVPLGCQKKICLHCMDYRTRERVRKIFDIIHTLSFWIHEDTGMFPPLGRANFTVPEDQRGFVASRDGSLRFAKEAHQALLSELGVQADHLPVWTTFHPTSSKEPWKSHPHIEVHWIHAEIRDSSPRLLDWENPRKRILGSHPISR